MEDQKLLAAAVFTGIGLKQRAVKLRTSKSQNELSPEIGASPSAFEICVVDHYLRSPLILTQTVQLTARRVSRNLTLDAIPEDENNTIVVKPLDSQECEEIAEDGRQKTEIVLVLISFKSKMFLATLTVLFSIRRKIRQIPR